MRLPRLPEGPVCECGHSSQAHYSVKSANGPVGTCSQPLPCGCTGYSPSVQPTFNSELKRLINRYGLDSRANTPDHVLADYLASCLRAYEEAAAYRGVPIR